MFETILLATEASADDEDAYPVAERMALSHGSKLVVVFVGAASSVGWRVHDRIAHLRERGIHARLAVIADGRDEAAVMAHLATAWKAGPGGGGRSRQRRRWRDGAARARELTVPRARRTRGGPERSGLRLRPQQARLQRVVDEIGAGREPQLDEMMCARCDSTART